MANPSALTGTSGDAARDMLTAGQTPDQVAAWLRGRLPESEISAFLGGAGSGDLSPAGLAGVFRQPDVTLPRGEEAKGALRDLQLEGVGGLRSLIGADPSARRKALEDAYFDTAAADIDYSADRTLRDVLEGQNSKNMLTSSATGDYFVEPVERARGMAKERARNTAFTTAGQDVRAEQASQAQLLGQAFNQGTTGLQADANVEASNRAANQSATQAGYTTGAQLEENAANRAQQESQFGRSLGQQKDLQQEAFANTRDIADRASTSAAIGGSIGGLATLFGPTANKFLQGFI